MKKTGRINYLFPFLFFTWVVTACDPSLNTTDVRDPLEGSWTCRETGGQSYQVSVSKAPLEDDKMYFYNLYNLKSNVEVIMSGNILSIPRQTVSNFELYGSGSVASNKKSITLSFTADEEQVEAQLTKND